MRKRPVRVELKDPELLELMGEEEESWWNSLPVEEKAKYGGQYIATRKKRGVAASESLDQLYRELEVQGIKHVRIRYVEEPDMVVIY